MNRFTGLILALALATTVGACASAGAGGATADGFKPRDSKFTREAERSLALALVRPSDEEKRQLYQKALESAQLAIQEDSTNPQGWFIAGQAYANLGEFEEADAAWVKAQTLYPGYEQDIVSERESAWVRAYNEGVMAIQQDDLDAAIAHMEAADRIYQGRPEAKLQLGVFYARKDQPEKAIEYYRGALEILRNAPKVQLDSATQADWKANEEIALSNLAQLLLMSGREAEAEQLFRDELARNPNDIQAKVNLADALARQGKTDEANQLYNELISRSDLSFNDYLVMGVGLFQAEQYEASAKAFAHAVRVNPYSRDGYYNLAQALYMRANKLEREPANSPARASLVEIYTQLASSAEKVLELDPFNRNIMAYQARAYQALSELTKNASEKRQYREKIQAVLDRHESLPFEVTEISLAPAADEVTVQGRIMNLKARAGEPIRLRLILLDSKGSAIGSQEVSVSAPEANGMVNFQAKIRTTGELAGWRYEQAQ